MNKKVVAFLLLMGCSASLHAQVTVSTPILYLEADGAYAVCNVTWPGWANGRNHDAVWLFFKAHQTGKTCRHIDVMPEGHAIVANHGDRVELTVHAAKDRKGVFIAPTKAFKGQVNATVRIGLSSEALNGLNLEDGFFEAYGIEMVYIPEGPLQLGTRLPAAIEKGAIFLPGKDPLTLEKEKQTLRIGPNADLYYQAPEGNEGDQQGTLPEAFPKGIQAFYCMKYEVTEGQYVDFLNGLRTSQQALRTPTTKADYEIYGGIQWDGTYYFSQTPEVPAAYLSWDDAMALADWTGLRPMSELEYAKASRGHQPVDDWLYPWGSLKKHLVQRWPNEVGELVPLNGMVPTALTDSNRVYFGASFYWVMDLAGSKWERLVSIGHPKGRAFKGTHGDGVLSVEGDATNDDWPSEEDKGFGLRGGGFYGYGRPYHEFNPFSPVSYRPYGAWAAGESHFAYGCRLVRTE